MVRRWEREAGELTLDFVVHGEAGFVKQLRRVLRVKRALPLDRLSVSGYWHLGHDEDGWQSSKREWNRQVEAEQEADTRAAS